MYLFWQKNIFVLPCIKLQETVIKQILVIFLKAIALLDHRQPYLFLFSKYMVT